MFSLDALVVYPAQGVGKVERIESQTVGGQAVDFYIVRILSNNVTLMVPVVNAVNVGLRNLCPAQEASAILESLKGPLLLHGVHRPELEPALPRILREVEIRLPGRRGLRAQGYCCSSAAARILSFGERRLLEQAMGLLSLEVAFSLDIPQDDVKQTINDMFEDVLKPKTPRMNPAFFS